MRSASEVEQNIVSVERILHYVKLPPEAPIEVPETKPAEMWPSEGEVEFRYVIICFYMQSRSKMTFLVANIRVGIAQSLISH